MQLPSTEIIAILVIASLIFILVPAFLLLYVRQYNLRKIKHADEKKQMAQHFESELLKTQMEVQEQTMQTIASNLHDNIGQLLSLTAITLKSIKVENEKATTVKVANSVELVNRSVKELRELSKLMNGEQYLSLGLSYAIEQEINWLSKSGVHQITLQDDLRDLELRSAKTDIILLRLFQELTNNIIKHAQATKFSILLGFEDDLVKLQIVDNGIGFDYESAQKDVAGLGLFSIRKRVELLQGNLKVDSKINQGTATVITIPYP